MQHTEREKKLVSLGEIYAPFAKVRNQFVRGVGEAAIGNSAVQEAYVKHAPATHLCLWSNRNGLVTMRRFGPIFDFDTGLIPKVALSMRSSAAGADLFPEPLAALTAPPAGSMIIGQNIFCANYAMVNFFIPVVRRLVALRNMIIKAFRSDL